MKKYDEQNYRTKETIIEKVTHDESWPDPPPLIVPEMITVNKDDFNALYNNEIELKKKLDDAKERIKTQDKIIDILLWRIEELKRNGDAPTFHTFAPKEMKDDQ